MSSTNTYEAEPRTSLGSTAAAKLRSAGRVPATISKRGAPSRHISLAVAVAEDLLANVTHICKVKVEGKELTVLKGEVSRHCLKDSIEHIDLQEVDAKGEINVEVEVRVNARDCAGVKSGGIIEQSMRTVKVRCPANAIPDFIELPLANVQLQEVVLAKALIMPKGVTMATPGDKPVLSIVIPRWAKKAEEEAKPAEGAAATAEGAKPAEGAKAAEGAKPADAKAEAKPAADAKKK